MSYLKKNIKKKLKDPLTIFHHWYCQAIKYEVNDPNAMSLATVDKNGMPNVRIVLLKSYKKNRFSFYTNYESKKGEEILDSMKVAICIHWKSLKRQVRIKGFVKRMSKEDADIYYDNRNRNHKIGAWASLQSRTLVSKKILNDRFIEYKKYFLSKKIVRPIYWSGFFVYPLYMEFWQNRLYRLHKRIVFKRYDKSKKTNNWISEMLYP